MKLLKTKTEKPVQYPAKVLNEFKSLISNKLDIAKQEYESLAQDLKKVQEDSSSNNVKEDIPETIMFDEMKILARRQQDYITNLEYALLRIKNGSYGVCRVTGKLIPVERLRAVPTATVCVEAKKTA